MAQLLEVPPVQKIDSNKHSDNNLKLFKMTFSLFGEYFCITGKVIWDDFLHKWKGYGEKNTSTKKPMFQVT